MSLFKRVHNDPRLRLQRGRTEEVEVTKECDAAGKRSEHIDLLRDWGGSQISGKSFLLTAALQIGAGVQGADPNGPIISITTHEVRHCQHV